MRKLGLNTAALMAILPLMACTRAANPEPVPPSASSVAADSKSASPSVAPAPTSEGATSSATAPTSEGAAPTATAPAAASPKSYDDKTTRVETTVGEHFTINLPANITTPYKWVAAPSEPTLVLAERHYEEKPPAGCPGCVGYPGTDRLTFEAKAPGSTTLVLRYAPLRSKSDPPERELSIKVSVAKK